MVLLLLLLYFLFQSDPDNMHQSWWHNIKWMWVFECVFALVQFTHKIYSIYPVSMDARGRIFMKEIMQCQMKPVARRKKWATHIDTNMHSYNKCALSDGNRDFINDFILLFIGNGRTISFFLCLIFFWFATTKRYALKLKYSFRYANKTIRL